MSPSLATSHRPTKFWQWFLLAAVMLVMVAGPVFAQDGGDGAQVPTRAVILPQSYGGWVLLPALVAIALAIVTRQVIPALLAGTVVAAFMLCRIDPNQTGGAFSTAFGSVARAMNVYVVGAMVDEDHAKVILFTLMIGGMVGVVGASGGTRAMVDLIAKRASTRRRGQCSIWLAGLVVFFDDYANTMIIGPTMQPICDRLRISRAKLAYIVDSTAAPVASLALVGTWVGAELGYVKEGLDGLKDSSVPPFLASVDSWGAFLHSLPYRFYPIMALAMVAIIAWTGRDFGSMLRHEKNAVAKPRDADLKHTVGDPIRRFDWLLAAIPVLVLVFVTGTVLLLPGLSKAWAEGDSGNFTWRLLLDGADSYDAILFGALACLVAAIAMTAGSRRISLRESVDGMLTGMSRMFPAVVVLVLAWALSKSSQDLQVGGVVSTWLVESEFAMQNLPLAVFACAAGVSFATGTSWGTMGILCPVVVKVAADLGVDLPPDVALPLFYASVGSVLAGAIFGDHCSPISDTTVLSSVACGCELQDHVWTQLPYALVVAGVSMVTGDLLCSRMQWSPWWGICIGVAMLVVFVVTIGRKSALEDGR
ncbi:MAG: Na+/H+ antiporter NhaC family protein [Planctomycetes bacterium]|nr:Na+/H+ antiporter NhaC family protein [Planctomycetota bacterium]